MRKLWLVLPLVFTLFLLNSAFRAAPDHTIVATDAVQYDSLKIKVCTDAIWECQAIQDRNQAVIETTNGERHLVLLQLDSNEGIMLKLAEDNGTNYVTHLMFTIDPENDYAMYHYDILTDQKVPFQDWCEASK